MRLVAIDLTDRDPELVADRCWQAGATGLWEVDAATLRAGVELGELPGFLAALADLGPVDVTETESVELAGRATSVTLAGQTVELWVPATVFGDGTHPTTATCIELLTTTVTTGARVLDVGCGAGALAIGAALLGADVLAIDIDAEAVEATAANAARNGVAIRTATTPVAEIDEPAFDVVLANLTVGALAPLVPALVPRVRPGGSLVLSGMLQHQWADIRQAAGGAVEDVRVVDGWVTAAMRIG